MFMIFLGIIDLIAAAMIYFGDVPGPNILKYLIVGGLVLKGLMSALDAIRYMGG